MKKIITADQLPHDEEIYFKKDSFGYRIVHPLRNSNGKLNWFNILCGGKRNLIVLIILMLFVLGYFYTYQHDTAEMKKVMENPCLYCSTDAMLGVLGERNYGVEKEYELPNISYIEDALKDAKG